MNPQDEVDVPDLRPRLRLRGLGHPYGLHLVAASYVCAVLFFFGGGLHNWGGLVGVLGFWILVAGAVFSLVDVMIRSRRRKGIVGLCGALLLVASAWLIIR